MDWFLYDNGLRHERVKNSILFLYTILHVSHTQRDNITGVRVKS